MSSILEFRDLFIEKIHYYSPDQRYYVYMTVANEDGEKMQVYGNDFKDPIVGLKIYSMVGFYDLESKYPNTFKFVKYSVSKDPKDMLSVYQILKEVPGIGEITAKKIIKQNGASSALELYTNAEGVLSKIPGITKKQKSAVKTFLSKKVGLLEILRFFQHAIPATELKRLLNELDECDISLIEQSKYNIFYFLLLEFNSFIKLFEENNTESDKKEKKKCFIFERIRRFSENKSLTFTPEEIEKYMSRCKTNQDFKTKGDEFFELFTELLDLGVIKKSNYFDNYYGITSIINATEKLSDTVKKRNREIHIIEKEDLQDYITAFCMYKNNAVLDESQLNALQCFNHQLSIINGPPGSGKSFVIEAISYIAKNFLRKKVLALAPTGKAAVRLVNEHTFSSTIHKALRYNKKGIPYFNKKNPLEANIIIIDESSMVDVKIMNDLFNACSSDSVIIMVGDYNQLQPVDLGTPFYEMIISNKVPVFTLGENHRQGEESYIARFAYAALNGDAKTMHKIARQSDKTIEIIKYDSVKLKKNDMLESFFRQKCMELDPKNSLILTSSNADKTFINELHVKRNKEGSFFVTYGTKLINLQNDYTKEVFNGEIGYVSKVSFETFSVKFPGRTENVDFSYEEMDFTIEPAYAITVHKSQGSEAEVVYIIIDSRSLMYKLWDRKMLYTAITRAKKKVVLLIDDYTGRNLELEYALRKNKDEQKGYYLKELLEL